VAVATFTSPGDPGITHGDANDTLTPTPYVWVTADSSYTVVWSDGDIDPTGRFTFYYLDHQPTFEVTPDDIETGGIATKIDDPINNSGGYFASCYCSGDQGVTCPDGTGVVMRDPATTCANQITWNTSAIPPGTYWIVAVDNDPPFHVYYSATAPLRVAHGGTPLPAALILRPDGIGAWDTSYHLQWIADGKAPLSFKLEYGLEDTGTALMPQALIADHLTPAPNADGSFGYDWDVSQLGNSLAYWVRLTVTDGDGNATFTDSHFAATIFHNGGMVTPTLDLAMAPPKKKSGCEVGPDDGPSRGERALLVVLGALAVAFYVARRAAARSG